MNKVLVLFSLFFFSFIYSQQKVRIGVLTGANYYSLRGSEVLDNVESGFGYSIGLSFEYKISKKISLSTDLILEKKRVDYFYEFDYSYMNPDGSSEEYVHYDALTKNNFNFITLPITLKYIIGDKNPYFIKGGFFLAKMLSQKEKTKISPTLINYNNIHSENFPMASSVDNQDYGFTFGIGKTFQVNEKNYLNIELRNNLGIHNSLAMQSSNGYSSQEIKTNTVNLILNWSFNL